MNLKEVSKKVAERVSHMIKNSKNRISFDELMRMADDDDDKPIKEVIYVSYY